MQKIAKIFKNLKRRKILKSGYFSNLKIIANNIVISRTGTKPGPRNTALKPIVLVSKTRITEFKNPKMSPLFESNGDEKLVLCSTDVILLSKP